MPVETPAVLRINAWTGTESPTAAPGDVTAWALGVSVEPGRAGALAAEELDLRDWRHPEVGWGVVLVDDQSVPVEKRHTAAGAPDCIRELVEERAAPVFRYAPDLPDRFLARYLTDGTRTGPLLDPTTERGNGEGQLPRYLMIVGGPDDIPWQVQFRLNLVAFTGRLPLTGDGLDRYVARMMDDWQGSAVSRARPVFWSTDLGTDDITWLMHRAIAKPLADRYAKDDEVKGGPGVARLTGAAATGDALAGALAENKPALIVTTSHGMTGPLDKPESMLAQLGLPVDQVGATVSAADLVPAWQPDGAIWYAHACCSAGAETPSRFSSLVAEDSSVRRVLDAVAAVGPAVAPLPVALLGGESPLRAFVGHVEPTFDWTLRDPENKQVMTHGIREALYRHLFSAEPKSIGMALWDVYQSVGAALDRASGHHDAFATTTTSDEEDAAVAAMLRAQLVARDRQSMVILGDPAATLPAPA